MPQSFLRRKDGNEKVYLSDDEKGSSGIMFQSNMEKTAPGADERPQVAGGSSAAGGTGAAIYHIPDRVADSHSIGAGDMGSYAYGQLYPDKEGNVQRSLDCMDRGGDAENGNEGRKVQ